MSFELKKSYNFTTLAPTLLGNQYDNMKVKAILTSANALIYKDIATLHRQVKSSISGLPDSITDLTYILFENTDGEEMVLALEYINTDSITEVNSLNIRIELTNCTVDDIGVLKTRLSELGYAGYKITVY